MDTNRAADGDDEDDEDNIPLSSGVEVLRRSNKDDDDDDNVPLSLKYQTTPQSLLPVDTDVEVLSVNPAEMEVEVEDNNLLVVGDDGEMYGIDDMDVYIDFVIETK
ncbi:hypothetical protein Dimus_003166, partial [Dionaea muscipula]